MEAAHDGAADAVAQDDGADAEAAISASTAAQRSRSCVCVSPPGGQKLCGSAFQSFIALGRTASISFQFWPSHSP